MTRVLLLSCSLATFATLAACDVGEIPSDAQQPGVICEQPGVNGDGHHNAGMDCMTSGCHSPTSVPPVSPMKMGGTVYMSANDTTGKGTATIIVEWGAGQSQKFITAQAGGAGEATGNFYASGLVEGQPETEQLVGITFPATVTVSLCPDEQKVMQTKINSAADLACSKGGCHGNGTAKIYIK
jgi:hypothetical protein